MEMARRLGLDWKYAGPRDVFDEMRAAMPSIAGITWERLEADRAVTYPCEREGDAGEPVVFRDRFPTSDGAVEALALVPLSEVQVGGMAELSLVSDHDARRLRYLASLGLRVGVSFEVIARQPFRGPVTIRYSAPPYREQAIGHELAASLGCRLRGEEVG